MNVAENQHVIDPVCGMVVEEKSTAAHVSHDGKEYYFCCVHCQQNFERNPSQYLKKDFLGGGNSSLVQLGRTVPAPVTNTSAPPVNAGPTEYTCPMDPEVRQLGPGACPKCGMALEPATIHVPATRTEYTCPMHPEIVRNEPGPCPICCMALEPRQVTAEEANPEL